MAKRVFWGRFKIGRKFSDTWHRIPANSMDEAVGKFLKNTRFTLQEIQVTTKTPPGRK